MLSFISGFFNISDSKIVLLSYISDIAIWLVGFIFMAIGIRYMAKKLNIKKGLWMAYVPFINWILLGKIIGNAVVWGKKFNNVGIWVMVFSIIQTVFNFLLNIGFYLYEITIIFNVDFIFTSQFLIDWVSGEGVLYIIAEVIVLIVDIAYIFFEVSIIFMIFRLYAPESALLFSILSLFLNPPLFGILLFVVRKRDRRSFKQYYNVYNAYSNFYGQNGYQPHNQPPRNEKPHNSDVDPFPEFSNKTENSEKQNDSDDFFS